MLKDAKYHIIIISY